MLEALATRGVEVVDAGDRRRPGDVDGGHFDVVVVGLHRDFDYQRLAVAADAARQGARLIATNDDTTYPAEGGRLQPGAGSLLAAVVAASGATAVVAGKPYEPMVDLVRELAGPAGMAVGDRADTDGRFARALGYRFGLVLTGVTGRRDLPVDPAPDLVAADLAGLVEQRAFLIRGWFARQPMGLRVAGMADNDILARSRDAGSDAMQKASDAIDQLVSQLNKASDQVNQRSEEQLRQAQEYMTDAFERGRKATERLVDSVEKELRAQIAALRKEIQQLERRLNEAGRRAGLPVKKAPARKAAAKKTAAKKAPAKKTAAKKAPAKKTAAKKTPAKKTAAKKAPAKKAAGR